MRTNAVIYSHALLRIHIVEGQTSVRICSSLPASSSQRSNNQGLQSSISVEALLWGCHLELPANAPNVLTHPSHIGYHHQLSPLLLLFLITAAHVCCFLCGWGRSIAGKVYRVTVLLEDSSIFKSGFHWIKFYSSWTRSTTGCWKTRNAQQWSGMEENQK